MFLSKQTLCWSLVATLGALAGCGDAGDNVVRSPGGGVNTSDGTGGNASTDPLDGSGGGENTAVGGSGTGGTSGPASGGESAVVDAGGTVLDLEDIIGAQGLETECDGIDNDNNGITDDVDVEGDGVCDCLKIATLGGLGGWGAGDVFKYWLNERSSSGYDSLENTTLTEEVLSKYQVIVARRIALSGARGQPAVHAYTEAERTAMANWIRGGGGFMTTSGMFNTSDENINVNSLVAFAGMNYDTTSGNSAYSVNGGITDWSTHPTTENVLSANIVNGWEPRGNGIVVGRDSGGHTALLVHTIDSGRIAMWGDEWITYDSEWKNTTLTIERLWLNLLKWLSPPDNCQVDIPDIY
jgi:hypothetical protein